MQTLTIQIQLLSHNTGLTLYAQLVDSDFEDLGPQITDGFTEDEDGGGSYSFTYASFPNDFIGQVRFFNAADDTLLAFVQITPADFLTYQFLQLLASLNAGDVEVVSPVDSDNNLEIIQGDDYFVSEGMAPTFSSTNWPDLTGATVVFTARRQIDTAEVFQADCDVVTATGSPKVIRFELSAEDTAGLEVGIEEYQFDVEATLSNGHIRTLVRGLLTVLSQMTIPETP
jgi:hypothetical protein